MVKSPDVYHRRLAGAVCAALLWLLGGTAAVGQPRVENVAFQQEGTAVVITYDLIGDPGEEYEVILRLSANRGRRYDFKPQAIQGDVGEDIRTGLQRTIVWSVLEDYPTGLSGSDFRFQVIAEEQGRSAWWYVIGTGLVGGAVTSALTVFGGGSDVATGSGEGSGSSGGSGGGTTIPPPPSPPGN